jgi:hypothetical protein
MIHDWDQVENKDFKSDCILGFFRNHPIEDPSTAGQKFGILTAVKNYELFPLRYEENHGRRWAHFRAATKEEVEARTL